MQYNLTHCQCQKFTQKMTQMIRTNVRKDQSNNQKDSQQEMNNLSLGKTNSIEKQLEDVKIKKTDKYYWSKNNFQSNTGKQNITIEKGQWPKNTTLIVGVNPTLIVGVYHQWRFRRRIMWRRSQC